MNIQITGTYTDQYQIAMGQAYYFKQQHEQKAVFDYYFRKIPYDGGYVIFAGLADLLSTLKTFSFTAEELDFLASIGFHKEYLNLLKDFKFKGNIWGHQEGDLIFPTEPVLRIEGTLLETQLIETMLLNILNFQSLIATKAARIREVAPDKIISEFGLRRAQGLGGMYASRAAVVGGADSTSNVAAAMQYGIKSTGTMAHSYIQMHDEELSAFRNFAESNPENCILLVDTYDTLKSGVPNAITVAKEMEQKGQKLLGVRLDSGDLSYFARKTRQQLDQAGLNYVKIAASNQLDEYVVRSLIHQKAPIDILGIGTNLAIGKPAGALDGVYKLVSANNVPRIKVSENLKKTTLPGRKQVLRLLDQDQKLLGFDAVIQENEGLPSQITDPFDSHKSFNCSGYSYEEALQQLMKDGKILHPKKSLEEIKTYSSERLKMLPPEYKRLENPHIYKVGISPETKKLRDGLFKKYVH